MSITTKDASGVSQSLATSTTAVAAQHTTQHVIIPDTSGGLSIYRNLDTNATGVNVKASAGQLYGWYLFNNSGSVLFVKLYNKASAPTVGTDTPVMTIPLPAGGGANVFSEIGLPFTLGIGIGATTAIADNSTAAPSSNNCISHLYYK